MLASKNWYLRILYTIASFFAYFLVRYFSASFTHIAIAGTANIAEQLCICYVLDRVLQKYKVQSFQFTAILLLVCCIVSILFAAIGSVGLAMTSNAAYHSVLVLYFFSHLSGNYLSLQCLLIFMKIAIRKPSRTHWLYCIIFCTIIVPFNVFKNYNIFKNAVILSTFPLLAVVASKIPIHSVIAMNVIFIVVLYANLYSHRGPYTDSDSLSAIISSYFVIIINLFMSVIISVNVSERDADIANITKIKDDILFVSNQVSHDIRTPLTHIASICEIIETNEQQALVVGSLS
jgi:hypothetical protein